MVVSLKSFIKNIFLENSETFSQMLFLLLRKPLRYLSQCFSKTRSNVIDVGFIPARENLSEKTFRVRLDFRTFAKL